MPASLGPHAEDPSTVLHQLLPALARVFALPAQQLKPSGSQGRQGQGDEDLQRRLLAVQLEALHVLLLLLPLPHAAQAGAGGAGRGARWSAQLRQGLGLLLRGRISAVQRHSALQLAAAVVDLTGPGWLLGDSDDGAAAVAAATAARDGEAFFQLLVEVVKVETSVLLHDALAPGVPVPAAAPAAPAAGDWRPPAPRAPRAPSDAGSSEAGDGDHATGAALAADLAELDADGAAADVEPLLRVLASEQDRKELEEQLMREQRQAEAAQRQALQPGEHVRRVDETALPTGGARGGGADAACLTLCASSLPAPRSPSPGASSPPPTRPLQRCAGMGPPRPRGRVPPACCPPASPCWRPAWRRWLLTPRWGPPGAGVAQA